METIWVIIGTAIFVLTAVFAISLYCFLKIFFLPEKARRKNREEFPLPQGRNYVPYHDVMIDWQKQLRELPQKEVSMTSFDGLILKGTYFEYSPDAPIELAFHGYKGDSVRDLSGAVLRCFDLKHSVLIIDHRASGKSQGNVTTFGVKECRDCIDWVNFVIENINKDAKIIIGGISMGATTVMLASAEKMPKNVKAVLADCGYTSGKEIIRKVMNDLKYPANLLFPFVKIGARLFGGFDICEANAFAAMEKCKLPIIFYHGSGDDFVPCEMSIRNYNACTEKNKKLVIIDDAAHGLCYPANSEKYISELKSFFQEVL